MSEPVFRPAEAMTVIVLRRSSPVVRRLDARLRHWRPYEHPPGGGPNELRRYAAEHQSLEPCPTMCPGSHQIDVKLVSKREQLVGGLAVQHHVFDLSCRRGCEAARYSFQPRKNCVRRDLIPRSRVTQGYRNARAHVSEVERTVLIEEVERNSSRALAGGREVDRREHAVRYAPRVGWKREHGFHRIANDAQRGFSLAKPSRNTVLAEA